LKFPISRVAGHRASHAYDRYARWLPDSKPMRNLLLFSLKAAVSFALLYFAFAHVNFDLIGRQFNHLRYVWLAAAILLVVAQILLSSLRWQRIVRQCSGPGEPPFTTANAFRYNFVAAFFNQTLPSTIGGDAVRAWLLARDNGGWRSATYSVLIDRLVGLLLLAVLVTVCLPWSFALVSDPAGRLALLVAGFGSLAACLAFLALGFVRWRVLDRLWVTRQIATAAAYARGVFATSSGRTSIIAYSLVIHFLSVSTAWSLAKAVGAPLAWNQALFLVLPVVLIATVPLSIGGWGTRETAMVLAFGYAGLSQSDGLAVSVLLGIAMFVGGLPGGILWIVDHSKRRLAAP